MKVFPGSAKIVFEESQKAYDAVDETLVNYRQSVSNTLFLVTAAAAFFAFEDSNKGVVFYFALAGYGIAVLLAVLLYRPRSWATNIGKQGLDALANHGERLPPAKVYLDLARLYQRAHAENLHQINKPWGVARQYNLMLAIVGLTVLLMLLNSAVEPAN